MAERRNNQSETMGTEVGEKPAGVTASYLKRQIAAGRLRLWALDTPTWRLLLLKVEHAQPGWTYTEFNGRPAILDEQAGTLFHQRDGVA